MSRRLVALLATVASVAGGGPARASGVPRASGRALRVDTVRVDTVRVDTVRVDTVRTARGGAPTARLRGDTLWWIVPGGAFPRGDGPGAPDTLVVLFGRESGRDVAWRLVGRDRATRRPVAPVLLALLREVRAVAADGR